VALFALWGCAAAEVVPDAAPTTAPTSAPASAPDSAPAAYPEVELEPAPCDTFWGPIDEASDLDPARITRHIAFLADDKQQGRGVGTDGLTVASEYVAKELAAAGLSPAGDGGTWFQTFEVVVGTALTSPAAQQLAVGKTALALDAGWRPFAFSDTATLDAEVVFAGYGISAPAEGYDDYAGLDVKDKIVLVMRHEPQRNDPHAPFNGDKPSRYSDLRYKAHVAQKNGARALLVINDPASYAKPSEADPDGLYKFEGSAQAGIVAAHMTWSAGGPFVRDQLGLDLEAAQRSIDGPLKPGSKALGRSMKLAVDIKRTTEKVRNVVGVLTPAGASDKEVVIVGAHYDHLGFGGEGSLRPESHEVHNGADDNASGTAVVLELARVMAAAKDKLKRPVYFVAFTAEEIGIRGSQYFVEHPPVPTDHFAAMLNFDMVGRLREDTLHVSGVGTATEFATLTDKAARGTGLKIVPGRDGYGPSDHSPFYAHNVPVLFFFTGPHDQYHTPDDDLALINAEGARRVAAYAWRVLGYLDTSSAKVSYTQADTAVAGDFGGTGNSGYGPYLGTVPSFGETGGHGVKLQGVRAGSPAEQAGIRPGDLIVEFGGTAIKDLYDLTYALRDHKVGDVVEVVVDREGTRVRMTATLGKRK